jgi:16S rRNA (cytosine1402-N4)-methyltransferase
MHIPVLRKEIIEYLDPKPNENFIDCTVGNGGHAAEILEKTAPEGKLLGIDMDGSQIKNLESKIKIYKNRLILVNDNYANLEEVAKGRIKKVSGILLDLGFSSWHVDESKRGFSFLKNEPLDMRYSENSQLTAEKILDYWSESDIEKILREYGEEQFSKQIAEGIIEARKVIRIKKTFQLTEIVRKSVPGWYAGKKIHFATKTFQALRMAVNGELVNLEKVLPPAVEILKEGGRLAIISFHSLEDRIVKNFFRDKEKEGLLKILTKKPVQPAKEEIIFNNRSRSAKLRVAEKISPATFTL